MTVALVAYYLGPRLGIGNYLNRLLPPLTKALDQQGIDFKILASPNAFEKTPVLQRLSDAVKVVPELDNSPGKRYWWLATQFRQYCQRLGLNLVVWLSNPVVLPWHLPSIAVLHDVNEWKAKEKYGSRLQTALRSLIYLDASIWFAKKVIAVSSATESDLISFRPNIRPKLVAISNGADSSLTELPPCEISTDTRPFILSVGRIDPAAKRLPEALELVQRLREESQQPWEIHFVGGMNSSTQAEGEAFLETLTKRAWAHYQGHVDDAVLAQWYRQAAATVFLSDSEGFGCPIAESASFNKWVIVNRKNQAALEIGKGAIIPISTENLAAAATEVLAQLTSKESPKVNQSLPTWQVSAAAYAANIATVLSDEVPTRRQKVLSL